MKQKFLFLLTHTAGHHLLRTTGDRRSIERTRCTDGGRCGMSPLPTTWYWSPADPSPWDPESSTRSGVSTFRRGVSRSTISGWMRPKSLTLSINSSSTGCATQSSASVSLIRAANDDFYKITEDEYGDPVTRRASTGPFPSWNRNTEEEEAAINSLFRHPPHHGTEDA